MTLTRLARLVGRRLRAVTRRQRLDDELERELALHLEHLVEEYRADGLDPAAARAAARRALGNVPLLTEQCRDTRGLTWWHDLIQDLVVGARVLGAHPGFMAVVTLSLGLGIGANTAVLGAMNTLFRASLPVSDPDRVVVLQTVRRAGPQLSTLATLDEYFAWRDGTRSLESISVGLRHHTDLTDGSSGIVERVTGHAVTPEFFEIVGVQPLLGRLLIGSDVDAQRGGGVVLLSHRLWQRRFGEDTGIVGRDVTMNGRRVQVVGVMPQGFHLPDDPIEYWVPMRADPSPVRSPEPFYVVTGRLRSGVTIEQAQADADAVLRQRSATESAGDARGARVVPVRERMYGWTRRPLATLQVAVALVLLVACANVAGLLLARTLARQPELALRASLGAGRLRLARQLLAESLLLAMAGGVLGVAVTWAALRGLLTMTPPAGGHAIGGVDLDAVMLSITAVITLATGLLLGVIPAIVGSRVSPASWQAWSLRPPLLEPRQILVAAQIAVTSMLLVGAGLMLRTVDRLTSRDVGFETDRLLAFDFQIPIGEYMFRRGSVGTLPYFDIDPKAASILGSVAARLATVPGVQSVAGVSYPLLDSPVMPQMLVADAGDARPSTGPANGAYLIVTPGFFDALGATIVAGRDVRQTDRAGAPWIAIVNETAARTLWPGEEAVGRSLRLPGVPNERPREVVGVVRDMPLRLRDTDMRPVVYTSFLQQPSRYPLPGANMFGRMTFMVRGDRAATALLPAVTSAVAEAAPGRPLTGAVPVKELIRRTAANRGGFEVLAASIAAIAVVLAGIGIYGVMAYSVALRTREIAIRLALGGGRAEILARIGRPAGVVVAAGLIGGILGSRLLMPSLRWQLWGVSPSDPATLAAAFLLLLGVCILACVVPARRAASVDVAVALRSE